MSWKNPIQSDDPQAVEKLTAELAKCEELQKRMTTGNKIIRSMKGKPQELTVTALITEGGFSQSVAMELVKPDFAGRIGFAAYQLQNNNANIKRIKDRIASVSQNQAREEKETRYENLGLTVKENPTDQRVQLFFDTKPHYTDLALLKQNGWHWSPTTGAWQRLLNNASIHSAKWVVELMERQAPETILDAGVYQERDCMRCEKTFEDYGDHDFCPTCRANPNFQYGDPTTE